MTQEEKQLLLVDLCGRLPYNVKCRVNKLDSQICTLQPEYIKDFKIEQFELYLRPMSSMTEEEMDEYTETFDITNPEVDDYDMFQVRMIDWLYKHHFDIRGLIEKGLALEAPEGMY